MTRTLDVGVRIVNEGDLDKAFDLENILTDLHGFGSQSAGMGGEIRDFQLTVPEGIGDEDAELAVRTEANQLGVTLEYANVYEDDESDDD